MIPKMKDYRKCIGQGFAVWDQNWNVARKYICKGIKVEYDEKGNALPISLVLEVREGLRDCYNAADCYRTRRECKIETLLKGEGDLLLEFNKRQEVLGGYEEGRAKAKMLMDDAEKRLNEFRMMMLRFLKK